MALPAVLGGLFSFLGSVAQGIFGSSKKKAEVIESAFTVLNNANSTEAAKAAAAAQIISAEAKSGYFLAAVWRPMLMLFFAVLVGARWFGYIPPDMSEKEIEHVYFLLELGIGGYIGGRTLEKIVNSINVGGILKRLLSRYI